MLATGVTVGVRAAAPGGHWADRPAALLAPTPTPVTVTLDAVADSFVNQASPATNYGTSSNLYAALDSSLNRRVTLARFDLSSVPSGSTIKSASFQLNQVSWSGLTVVTLTMGRCTASWTETGVTWSNAPGLSAVANKSVGTAAGWVAWDATALVQGWVDKAYKNYGVGVTGPMSGNPYSRLFASRDKLPAPKLVVAYYPPAPAPTPTPTPTPPPPCTDPYEPNDTFATASPLDPPAPAGLRALICTATDTDYYSFAVSLRDELLITLDELPKNYDLELYDPSGTRLRLSANPGTAPETIAYTASNTAGAYRARVLTPTGEFDTTSRYHLTIQVTPWVEPVLVVNTTDDTGDGVCDAAQCTLREALEAVNAGTASRVQFSIPASDFRCHEGICGIAPLEPLPVVTRRVSIEGESQAVNQGDTNPSGPEIAVYGGAAGAGASGIVISGTSSSLIRHLIIAAWEGAGVVGESTTDLTVTGCFLGYVLSDGSVGTNLDGIVIRGGMSAHIGGAGPGEGNVIIANERFGVWLDGTAYALVYGNLIGVNEAGDDGLGNGHGVQVDGGSERCHVGGAASGEGNVIAANSEGVSISGTETSYNKVYGNWIGITRSGDARGNRTDGVSINLAHHNEVGGTAAGQKNRIGANAGPAIILTDADLNTLAANDIGFVDDGARPNGDGVILWRTSSYNAVASNTIRNSSEHGILVDGAEAIRNTFTRNLIFDNSWAAIQLHGIAGVAGNEGIAPPIVGAFSAGRVEGVACPLCTVELFSADGTQAEVYEGTTTANASGAWSWAGTPDRPNVRATATDALGNTSELTACIDPLEPNDTRDGARPITVNLPTGAAHEGFICHPTDLDWFSFDAIAGDVITADLRVPAHYTLRLFDAAGHELASDGDPGSLELRRIVYNVPTTGEYFVRAEGGPADFDPESNYRLAVSVQPLAPQIAVWFDEGWLADTEVYKLIPDAADPAARTLVDVVADVSVDSSEPVDLYLTVNVPGDPWGAPDLARGRDCTGCAATDLAVDDRGGGDYRVLVHLDGDAAPYRRQVVMRFGIPSVATVSSRQVTAEATLTTAGAVIGTGTSPELHVVDSVDAVIITSRHHLYEGRYDLNEAVNLLGSVTHAAQGPTRGPVGSRRAAIYYVDDYSELAREWDNETWDPTSEDTANVATREIDDLLEDWAEDSTGTEAIVILGDDDIIPFFRKASPCEGEESEYAWDSPPAIALLMSNDYMGTDHHYSELAGEGWWFPRTSSADVGRIIGDSAATMQALFEHGLAGPSPGSLPWAVLASWDGNDLDFEAGDEGILDHVKAWGYHASETLVDNEDWPSEHLLRALLHDVSIFAFSGPANAAELLTPPWFTGDRLDGGELADAMDDADSAVRRPFAGFLGDRTGYSLMEGALFDHLAAEGASGMVGVYGKAFTSPEGSEWYTEDVMNKFWRRAMPSSREVRSVGRALRLAKLAHDPTTWTCRHQTAVWGPMLFGIPWTWIPYGELGGPEPVAGASAIRTAPLAGSVRATAAGALELTASVDASAWSIDRATAPGFDLVDVSGFSQDPDAGPALPARMLEFPLPADAQVTSVEVSPELELDLGTLAVPTWVPGDLPAGGSSGATWVATPASAGTVPAAPFTHAVVQADGHTMVHVKLLPVRYDAATGQTTLFRQLAVRVLYSTSEPIGVIETGLNTARVAPGEAASAWADVVNASDVAVELTTEAVLRDTAGSEVACQNGGPFSVPAGVTTRLAFPLPATGSEGAYDVDLRLLRNGSPVGGDTHVLLVTTGYITAFEAPRLVVPGRAGVLTVTYANTAATTLEVEARIDILSLGGAPLDSLAPQALSIPPHAEATASFSWDARSVTQGRYQARATATPASGAARTASRIVEVRAARPVSRRLGGPK